MTQPLKENRTRVPQVGEINWTNNVSIQLCFFSPILNQQTGSTQREVLQGLVGHIFATNEQ